MKPFLKSLIDAAQVAKKETEIRPPPPLASESITLQNAGLLRYSIPLFRPRASGNETYILNQSTPQAKAFHYCRWGSHKRGFLRVQLDSDVYNYVVPGQTIRRPFSKMIISSVRAMPCVAEIVVDVGDGTWTENASVTSRPPRVRLGAATTFTENTQPTLVTHGVEIFGVSKFALYIDGGGANTMTSVDFIPWIMAYLPSGGGGLVGSLTWYEMADFAFHSPTPATGTTRNRRMILDVEQFAHVPFYNPFWYNSDGADREEAAGYLNVTSDFRLYLEPRNLLPAAATSIDVIFESIE